MDDRGTTVKAIGVSPAVSGGTYIDSSGGAVKKVADLNKSYNQFMPNSDGTFGTCDSNIVGLTGSAFIKGIPVYFNAKIITIATGSGTLYN